MHPVSCTNTHHGITDLVNHGVVKKYKNSKISSTEHNFSIKQKKILTCASDRKFWEVIVL